MVGTKSNVRRLSLKFAALATLLALGIGAVTAEPVSAAIPRNPHYRSQYSRGPNSPWQTGYSGYNRSQAYHDAIRHKNRQDAVRIHRNGSYVPVPSYNYTPRHHGGYR